MGACRTLNVLLGMSVMSLPGGNPLSIPWGKVHWLVAGALGLYVTGVTLFSRGETGWSKRPRLTLATIVMLLAIGLLVFVPYWTTPTDLLQDKDELWRWHALVSAMAAFTLLRCAPAIWKPSSRQVQATVTRLIYGLVVLDAVACFSVAGIVGALFVFLFLFPVSILGRWVYST